MKIAVDFDAVSFSYPGADRRALDDVNVAIPEGAFALVVGPTGSGKSTFLRGINGLVPHFTGGTFSGRVMVGGRSTLDGAPRDLADAVAFVPQDPGASFVVDRVEDEIAYGLENLGAPANVMRRRVEETLDLLDLVQLAARSVRTLSGGERQRVAIAAALAAGPRILVLDEPTSQLDPQGAEDVLAALQRLVHDLGITVVAAEHRLERVAGFADLAVRMTGGAARRDDPASLASYAGAPPVARLGRALGWDPPPLTVREARRLARDPGPVPSRTPPAPGPVLLSARRLGAGFGSRQVLREVDVELRSGEVVAIMGRNGSGKTTLLRALAGVHPPASGTVLAGDHPPLPGRDVALCPQTPETVLFRDSVAAEIAATRRWSGAMGTESDPTKVLDLGSVAERHPRDLSAGQRLLVAVAATVATGAPVVLLDEPTRGLDREAKDRLGDFLASHAAAGGAAGFATHDVEMVAAVAHRVVILGRGEVIAAGTPAEVMGDSAVFAPQMTRVFGPGWLTPEQVLDALTRAGRSA